MTTQRANTWSLTINNPTSTDLECLSLARQAGWKVLGQMEVGLKDGTPHYQLMLRTPQVRFSAVKKMFPRAHIEVARQPAALARYVVKEESRVGDLPEQQDKYPSLSKFWDLVFQHLNGLGKDGLDYVELDSGVVCMYRPEIQKSFEKNPLHYLDEAVNEMIRNGYHVESIASNPSTRSMWKLYNKSIILRSYNAITNVDIPTQQDADDDSSTFREGSTQELQEFGGLIHEKAETCSSSEDGSYTGSEIRFESTD